MKRTKLIVTIICWIICFIAIVVLVKLNAQEKSMGEVIVLHPDREIRVTIGDKEYVTNYQYMMFLGLMATYYELKLYEAECYPDSVRFIPPNTFERLDPTFTGFIKFLDKRFKGVK